MLANLVSEALAMRAQSAVHERDKNDFDFRSKVAGSFVVTEELGSLARRDASVVKRYGESEVEVRFEQQLSFLMQSFGFIVVTTQRAQRRVDLICIAQGASGDSFTFLVEAKTTGASYSLPTRDARAITEYVSSVRQALKTLPRLRLVLLVSGSPTKTIDDKLGLLEAECGVAVRYCDVVLLQRLRRLIPGPLDYTKFIKILISAGRVLGGPEIKQLIESDRAVRVTHSQFVRDLLINGP